MAPACIKRVIEDTEQVDSEVNVLQNHRIVAHGEQRNLKFVAKTIMKI